MRTHATSHPESEDPNADFSVGDTLMTGQSTPRSGFAAGGQTLANKVPEVTIWFWILKILCTTVGETAADLLNVTLGLGLTGTSVVTGALLAVLLAIQFRARGYVPAIYWLTVMLVSVFGTLVTDNLTDALGVPLEVSTLVFAGLLAITFLVWFRSEHTLSIHSIVTRRREAFYWLAILFTFALGTAAGDLLAEALGLGYLVTGLIVAALIAADTIAWRLGLNSVLAFWIAYILTRPLGASIGDLLSQPASHGGLGLGSTLTSALFLIGIVAIVIYLTVSKVDVIDAAPDTAPVSSVGSGRSALWQTVTVVVLLIIAGGAGYYVRKNALTDSAADAAASGGSAAGSPLGDLTTFRVITVDTQNLLTGGDQAGATTRIGDLEYEWDTAQSRLKPIDPAAWTELDGRIDTALRELRAAHPNVASEQTALSSLLADLG